MASAGDHEHSRKPQAIAKFCRDTCLEADKRRKFQVCQDVYIYEQTTNRPCPTPWTGRIGQQVGLRIGMRYLAGSGPTCALNSADCWTCSALVQLAPHRPENSFYPPAISSALLVSKTDGVHHKERTYLTRSACRNWLDWLLCENHNNQQTSNWHSLSPPSQINTGNCSQQLPIFWTIANCSFF